MGNTMMIGGLRFSSFMKFKKKVDADATAKRMRARVKGYKARVIKKSGAYPYELYTRR